MISSSEFASFGLKVELPNCSFLYISFFGFIQKSDYRVFFVRDVVLPLSTIPEKLRSTSRRQIFAYPINSKTIRGFLFFSPKNCGLHSSADYIRVRISFFFFFQTRKKCLFVNHKLAISRAFS